MAEDTGQEAAAVEEAAPAEAEAPEATQAPPDLAGEIQSLHSKIDAMAPKQSEPDQDFMDQLIGFEDEEEPAEPEYDFRQAAEDQYQQEGEAELQQLYDAVDARQEERFAQYEAEQEFNRRNHEMNDLVEQMPDLKKPEYLEPIQRELTALAERNGNEWIKSDPALVKALFLSMKAQETADKQRASEKEASDAATLETGAGPSAQGADDDQEYADRIVKAGGPASPFTS